MSLLENLKFDSDVENAVRDIINAQIKLTESLETLRVQFDYYQELIDDPNRAEEEGVDTADYISTTEVVARRDAIREARTKYSCLNPLY